jgi:hypothetical protein
MKIEGLSPKNRGICACNKNISTSYLGATSHSELPGLPGVVIVKQLTATYGLTIISRLSLKRSSAKRIAA